MADPMRHETPIRILSRHGKFDLLALAMWCMALAGITYAYGQRPDAEKIEESMKRVQQWHLHKVDPVQQMFDVRLLAQAGATQAIPPLKQEFAVTKDTSLKLAIASALVRIGDNDRVYWDFLADAARAAVENDAPPVFQLDSEGKVDQRAFSPEFIAWAKSHSLDPAAAAQAQTFELPGNFLYLAETGDPRGRELLRRGLKSSNFTIQSIAARGLAKLHDKDSIPLIVEVCVKMTRERASYIARALLFFDDPRAQSAAEIFISDKQLLEELRSKIRPGADPFSY